MAADTIQILLVPQPALQEQSFFCPTDQIFIHLMRMSFPHTITSPQPCDYFPLFPVSPAPAPSCAPAMLAATAVLPPTPEQLPLQLRQLLLHCLLLLLQHRQMLQPQATTKHSPQQPQQPKHKQHQ